MGLHSMIMVKMQIKVIKQCVIYVLSAEEKDLTSYTEATTVRSDLALNSYMTGYIPTRWMLFNQSELSP